MHENILAAPYEFWIHRRLTKVEHIFVDENTTQPVEARLRPLGVPRGIMENRNGAGAAMLTLPLSLLGPFKISRS